MLSVTICARLAIWVGRLAQIYTLSRNLKDACQPLDITDEMNVLGIVCYTNLPHAALSVETFVETENGGFAKKLDKTNVVGDKYKWYVIDCYRGRSKKSNILPLSATTTS